MVHKKVLPEPQFSMVTMDCSNCFTEMELQPIVLTTYPPMYQYVCPKCGHYETSHELYPYLEIRQGERVWKIQG